MVNEIEVEFRYEFIEELKKSTGHRILIKSYKTMDRPPLNHLYAILLNVCIDFDIKSFSRETVFVNELGTIFDITFGMETHTMSEIVNMIFHYVEEYMFDTIFISEAVHSDNKIKIFIELI